ncbi:DUF6299 family protein [Streptomyces sp. NBC_01408]|uniref:DUF6299 family protein n=1 Tax=Streptomyces sp. NBC_01408 TaxID=2903855 RepID=UPI00224F7B84|nr:DUF6299 family protein [Streptomyces sp. NBC_01408]MCX4692801.1 DUF6299 family protein [Streptomyces sp. NBC_01408]
MGIHATRMAVAALSALAAAAVFTAPAEATVYDQGISVQEYGHISEDGTVTLSGTYHCTNPSPKGAKLQIAASVTQGGTRLAFGGGEADCDGEEHAWEATGSLKYTPGIRPGAALAGAQLNEIHFSGLMPRSIDTVAEDQREIRLIAVG